jgi:uncharacterized surface protein with fasciclin (FAS1) repeats
MNFTTSITAATITALAAAGMLATSTVAAQAGPPSPVGTGYAGYAKQNPTGPASVMAQDPVAVATANNPMLTTLTSAVSGKLNPNVNLVDTLDGADFTVFAPVDAAFAKIPADTIDGLKTDSQTLTNILTYHVVPGRLSPAQIDGTHKTVEGTDLTVTGSGDNIKVNNAAVICGGVQTANATDYMIDTVMMPPAPPAM